MNRYVVSLFMLFGVLSGYAQGMSDSQVLQYIQREMKAGATQSQVAVRLMQRGVTMQQLQRVRNQYERQAGQSTTSGTASSANGTVSADSRLRQNNGSVRVDAQGNALYTQSNGVGTTMQEISNLDERPNVYLNDTTDNTINGKRVFGRDIFNRRALSFEPNMNIPTPENYVVGPGDKVNVDIYGASQKAEQLEVSPDGTVTIEGFGPIHLAGLTVKAANQRLKEQLGDRYKSSTVRLTVGQTRTITVNVMGEVRAPGTYTLSAFASVFHALYMSGGVNSLGTLRNIKVYRSGKPVATVDIYDYILNGKLSGNVRLADGDVIVVGPYDCIVDLTGKVKRPMAYEMRRDESVATLLKYAGGFAGNAYRKAVRLNRMAGERYSAFNIPEFEMADFRLMDGDSLTVDTILVRFENTVEVRGAVFRPGQYHVGGNITSVRSLIEAADGLTEDAFKSHAVLHRMREDRVWKVLSVDVAGIMAGTVADLPLENEDILFIPTKQERMNDRTITIHGEVQMPGRYEYAEDETIEDFILQAGGLTDAASTARVDVSRRILNPNATDETSELATTFRFTVKDGLVVDGDRSFTLKPYDEVYVRRSPGYQVQRNVQVEGEVLFAGDYTLTKKNQRLTDLVASAGGLTSEAYVRGARVERQMTNDEIFRFRQLIRMASMSSQQGIQVDTSGVDSSAYRYYVGIELDKALAEPGSDYDIILREGDRLVVPEYNGTVKINGVVMYPNTVAYQKGKTYKWYVNQAGGFGNRAKKSRTYILYQNGTVAKANRYTKIEPGCEIIVPAKVGQTLAEQVQTYATIGSSLTSMITMLATVTNLVK